MSKRLNIDDSIKEKLDGFSAAPPPHVWTNIQTNMAARRKKRRLAYVGWISAAAVVVLAFIAGWYFSGQNTIVQPMLVEQQQATAKSNAGLSAAQDAEIEGKAETSAGISELIANSNTEPITAIIISENSTAEQPGRDGEIPETTGGDEKLDEHYSLLQSIDAFLAKNMPDLRLQQVQNKPVEPYLTAADEVLIASNIKTFETVKNKENGWIVGAHVSPGYSSHSAQHKDTYSQNMTYQSDNGGGNVGGGISVQYKTSKRLRVESGVYYAKDGQKAKNSFNLFAFKNDADYMTSPEFSYDDAQPAFSNVVTAGSEGIAMNSTAGVIKMQATPQGAQIAANLETDKARADNVLYADGEFSQVFEFVEIPLYLRYSILDKRLGIELLGGVNAGFVIGNNAYLDNNYGVQNIGSTADISTLNFSGTLGVGVNYMLGKHFSLALEPRINYYLNSINSNPDVDYRPYRLGVYTGIYYEF
ncbi:hypothetical protein [uncultured Draconibacterium sp.]|uniref:hypothetical protein n=1 Tax=uncultured Draconibacterium sp. TaxID=1573823 RepID=UPI0025D0D578|nr:hypothetical protein [uncultured Draconibacterium sp.]